MTRFVVGDDRCQSTLFPERLDDYSSISSVSTTARLPSIRTSWPTSLIAHGNGKF
jgi:hypothetical protein